MDRLSVKVLKFLKKQGKPTHESLIIQKLSPDAHSSLEYLKDIEYIREIQQESGMFFDHQMGAFAPKYTSAHQYELKPQGRDFLQNSPANRCDRWITRICAIVGAITGIAALILEYLYHGSN